MWLGRSYGGAAGPQGTPLLLIQRQPVASCIIYVVSGDVVIVFLKIFFYL
jgi:hypothetical protein